MIVGIQYSRTGKPEQYILARRTTVLYRAGNQRHRTVASRSTADIRPSHPSAGSQ